jgi:hypothetical protein
MQNAINTKTKIANAKATVAQIGADQKALITKKKGIIGLIGYTISLAVNTAATIAATIATKLFNKTLLKSPFVVIVGPLMLLVGALFLLKKGFDDNRNGVTSFAGSFAGLVKSLGVWVKGIVSAFGSLLKGLKPVIAVFLAFKLAHLILASAQLKLA